MVLTAAAETVGRGHRERLLRGAIRVLLQNWHGNAKVPSRSLYPHQWSWDSAFIALGLQHISPERAATELFSLFGAQWADGRIPQIGPPGRELHEQVVKRVFRLRPVPRDRRHIGQEPRSPGVVERAEIHRLHPSKTHETMGFVWR